MSVGLPTQAALVQDVQLPPQSAAVSLSGSASPRGLPAPSRFPAALTCQVPPFLPSHRLHPSAQEEVVAAVVVPSRCVTARQVREYRRLL